MNLFLGPEAVQKLRIVQGPLQSERTAARRSAAARSRWTPPQEATRRGPRRRPGRQAEGRALMAARAAASCGAEPDSAERDY